MKPIVLCFLFLPLLSLGQGSLTGRITDTKNKPFDFCKLILSRDSIHFMTTETDSTGSYAFNVIDNGDYQLRLLLPSEKIDTLVSVLGATMFNLQIAVAKELYMVEITAEKPVIIQKVDRTIFNPSNIPALIGGNASDVIEFAPGVFIDGDNIRLANGNSADVLLNDKLIPMSGSSLISFIKAIPAEDIQYIEIVPIPPVKYAVGVGSFINIKLLPGTKSRYSKGGLELQFGQRFYSEQRINGNYALRRGKFSLYATTSLDNSNYRPAGTKTIDYDTLFWDENYTELRNYKAVRGSLGMNYDINSTTELGVLAYYGGYLSDNNTYNGIIKTALNDSSIHSIENYSRNRSSNQNTSVNINLSKKLDTLGQKLDFNIDYTNHGSEQAYNFETFLYSISIDSTVRENNEIWNGANLISSGIDYSLPRKKITWNLGARYSFTKNENDLAVFQLTDTSITENPQKSNQFVYNENIQAAYTSLEWKIKRFSFQAGIRIENTSYKAISTTTNETFSQTYLQLVPKVFVMYESKKGQTWNLNYNRDFDRPYYSELNPFKYYTSQFSYTVGNPNLQPTIRHSVTVSTNFKDFQFQVYSAYHQNGANLITVYDDSTAIQYTTTANFYSEKYIALAITYYKFIKKRVNIDANIYTSYSITSIDNTIQKQELRNLCLSTSLHLRFTLDKKQTCFASLSSFYISPFYQRIELNTEGVYTNLSLSKNLLKNRMNIKLSVRDPFKLMNTRSKTIVNNVLIYTNYYHDMAALYFTFSYKFGNNRLEINQHSTNASGEAGRIK